jgi:hypothetical protein
VIKVYAKPGGYNDNSPGPSRLSRNASGLAHQSYPEGNIVDGTNGFVDLMAPESRGQLYSDRLVDTSRRGQGRGRGGR